MNCASEKLNLELSRCERLAIAFSGGCDSTLLAEAAARWLGRDRVLLLLADSALLPRREFERAVQLAGLLKLPLEIIEVDPLADASIRRNDPLRCYHCKKVIFTRLIARAATKGFVTVADGANADDAGDYRPGARAADELGVFHPMRALRKQEIRELAREWQLPTWDLPAAACLASRIPTNTALEADALQQVEAAEIVLSDMGFTGARFRRLSATHARLEFPGDQTGRAEERRSELVNAFYPMGLAAIDIAEYKTGSMNQPSPSPDLG